MRIMRAFPRPGEIPPGRAYVQDDLERLYTPRSPLGNGDFAAVRDITEPLILVEWDVAIDRRELARFELMAEGRDWPMCGPHYKIGEGGHIHWVMFRETPAGGYRTVWRGEPDCDRFPMPGLLYLPGGLLADCPASDEGSDGVMNEGTIGRYLRRRPDWRPYPIAWDIKMVHLH